MKLKRFHFADGAEIQEAVTDELKKGSQKRNFRQLFGNCTTAQKPVYVPMELILNKKKGCLRLLKKLVLKLLNRTVYFFSFIATGRLYFRCHRTSHRASGAYGLDVLCAKIIKWDTYAVGGAHSTHGGNEEFMNYDGRKIAGKESLGKLRRRGQSIAKQSQKKEAVNF
jgi:hypothetical protein